MKKVLYPGSFDPITKGHMNIIDQSLNLFDEVVVGVLVNPNKKNYFFDFDERLELIKKLYKDDKRVTVVKSDLAAVDVAIENNCSGIIRGLRGVTDFDYEISLSQINKDISDGKVNTVCLFADSNYSFLSSSMVKEVFNLGKDISLYVDSEVKNKMEQKKVLKNGS
ncbi:MAG: pantetheine-phosphate adenylyltransferase [Bacilli bacterium]|nr:pantetheine-phosphate adenylyltransferase [Bacilli bacterium]